MKVSASASHRPSRTTHVPAILFRMSPAFHPSDQHEESSDDDDPNVEDAFAEASSDDDDPTLEDELPEASSDDDDPDLEDEFPMGDGVADVSTVVYCPYCGEPVEIALDPGSGSRQQYVEDCQVCCQPWRVSVYYDADGHASVQVTPEDER